jgi:hypothetical protein
MKKSARARRMLFAGVFVGAWLSIFVACNATNSLVGGSCAEHFVSCSPGECTDLETDPQNCGACGNACAAGVACAGGVCGGAVDGAADGQGGDGAGNDGTLTDGQNNDGANGDGSNGDGANGGDGSSSDGQSGDACVPPFVTAANCGACGVVCVAPNSVCNSVDGGFACGPLCTDPAFPDDCNGVCVDFQTDPNNCGACGKVCASGICVAALCQGSTPGDIVLVGDDFTGAQNSTAPAKLLTNATFIPSTNPLRVLSYEQFAAAGAVTTVKNVINAGATARGRTVKFSISNVAADLSVLGLEAKYDVVLVHDQATLTAAEAATDGAADAAALLQFTKAGGVVIVLDGANGEEAMPPFVTNAGLVDLAGHTFMPTPGRGTVVAPADDVGTGTVSPFAIGSRFVNFQSNEPNGGNVTFVVLAGSAPNPLGDPIVIHKTVP